MCSIPSGRPLLTGATIPLPLLGKSIPLLLIPLPGEVKELEAKLL